MAEQLIDDVNIPALVLGMQRINQEKSQIKRILEFLADVIKDVAYAGVNGTTAEGLGEVTIFSIEDSTGNSLLCKSWMIPKRCLFDSTIGGRHFKLEFLAAGNSDESTRLLFACEDNPAVSVTPERLPARTVGACFALLPNLVAKAAGHDSRIARQLEVFYAAAKRVGE